MKAGSGSSARRNGRADDPGIDWIVSEFVRALAVADLPPGQAVEVDVGGRSVALFNVGGMFYALVNRCPHRGGPSARGSWRGRR